MFDDRAELHNTKFTCETNIMWDHCVLLARNKTYFGESTPNIKYYQIPYFIWVHLWYYNTHLWAISYQKLFMYDRSWFKNKSANTDTPFIHIQATSKSKQVISNLSHHQSLSISQTLWKVNVPNNQPYLAALAIICHKFNILCYLDEEVETNTLYNFIKERQIERRSELNWGVLKTWMPTPLKKRIKKLFKNIFDTFFNKCPLME